MNYLTLFVQLTTILQSSTLRGDKAAYFACRTLATRFEQRNPGIYADCGYAHPIETENVKLG